MAIILLLDQVRRRKYHSSPSLPPPEDPEGRKSAWAFLIFMLTLISLSIILILLAA